MKLPVNLVLEIRTQEEYDYIQTVVEFLKKPDTMLLPITAEEIALLDRITMRLPDTTKESRVLITGVQIAMGTLEEMNKRYETEIAMHRSNVVLEEWQDGNYKSIRSRRLQKL